MEWNGKERKKDIHKDFCLCGILKKDIYFIRNKNM